MTGTSLDTAPSSSTRPGGYEGRKEGFSMKNIVRVLRFKDGAKRLYQLPTNVVVARGTVVEVEFGGEGSTAVGVTISNSYCGEPEETAVRDVLGVLPGKNFRRVVAVYGKQSLVWSDGAQEDSTEDGAENSTAESRQKIIRECCEIAAHIAETGDSSRWDELNALAKDNEIFLGWDDDNIVVEDEVFNIR